MSLRALKCPISDNYLNHLAYAYVYDKTIFAAV